MTKKKEPSFLTAATFALFFTVLASWGGATLADAVPTFWKAMNQIRHWSEFDRLHAIVAALLLGMTIQTGMWSLLAKHYWKVLKNRT